MAWNGPLIVLTSKFSASASEILAGAIQDYGRGIIVGDETTHGKGTVQSLLDLGHQLFRDSQSAQPRCAEDHDAAVLPSQWREHAEAGRRGRRRDAFVDNHHGRQRRRFRLSDRIRSRGGGPVRARQCLVNANLVDGTEDAIGGATKRIGRFRQVVASNRTVSQAEGSQTRDA